MKRTLALLSGILLLTGCTTKPHAQFSSNLSQLVSENPQPIHFEPAIEIEGMDSVQGENGYELAIRVSGTHLIMFAPQVALVDTTRGGCFKSWIAVNKKPVIDSGIQHCFNPEVKETRQTAVVLGQVALNLEQGDNISVYMSGFNTRTLYVPPDREKGEPSVPATIFTVIKL